MSDDPRVMTVYEVLWHEFPSRDGTKNMRAAKDIVAALDARPTPEADHGEMVRVVLGRLSFSNDLVSAVVRGPDNEAWHHLASAYGKITRAAIITARVRLPAVPEVEARVKLPEGDAS